MPEPDLSLLFVRPLNQLGIRYMVGGSVAAILYGEPRLTLDVDFVVFLRLEDIARLRGAFPSPEFYVPPTEVIAAEIARELTGSFNFRYIRRMQFRGEPIVVAPPEYVIVRKLEYFRKGGSEKHLRDIRAMLAAVPPHPGPLPWGEGDLNAALDAVSRVVLARRCRRSSLSLRERVGVRGKTTGISRRT
jgi:hypothetical protein